MKTLVFFILWIGFFSLAHASLIPQNLNSTERKKVVSILGFGNMPSSSWSPRSLGGYPGTTVFLSQDVFSAKDLTELGNRQSSANSQQITSVGLGQGLYYDVDVFIYFAPLPQRELMNVFGGQIRKAFFRDLSGRLQISASLSASSAQYENLLSFTNTSQDIVMSIIGRPIDFSIGVGLARSIGQFIGGAAGITDSGSTETNDSNSSHLMVSGTYYYDNFNFTCTWDRYDTTKMTLKLAYKF